VTKPVRYFLRGIIADGIILAVSSLYLLVRIALSYKGRCGVFFFFGGQGRPCPRSEYVLEQAGFLVLGILDDTQTWLLILLGLGVLPILGCLVSRRRELRRME
jgi:hypothetical protein